jgi:hypothetical protein
MPTMLQIIFWKYRILYGSTSPLEFHEPKLIQQDELNHFQLSAPLFNLWCGVTKVAEVLGVLA